MVQDNAVPRGVKTQEEIQLLKKACTITDTIFSRLISYISKFETEQDVALFIKQQIAKYGCTPSFAPIVAAGKNAANPHHKPTNEALQKFVVIDFGVKYKGYCSDMTRTIYVGRPTKKERELYKKVVHALDESRFATIPGLRAHDVDAVARKVLGTALSKQFIHALGHGVGKRVHEFPRISSRGKFFLKKDMVITIEPGVYKKKSYGIRIEDTCHITEKACLALTKSPKDLIVV